MKIWKSSTLISRVTVLFALITCLVVTGLGMYLYSSVKQALEVRADYTLIGRVEHFRNLLHDLYTVKQMEQRPALFESMLGNEEDVRIFRRQGELPFIQVNPVNLAPPHITPTPVDTPLTIASLHDGMSADGVRVRWISALAEVGDHRDTVEIIAAYVMTQESHMLSVYLLRVVGAVALAVLLTTILGFVVLKHGLKPLTAMSERVAEITPTNLSARLQEDDIPPELHRLASAFNSMLERLDMGFENLSQFSSDLAHEIRTPVNILMGQSQVTLGQTRSPDEYIHVLESNQEELSRLSRIIENILFLAHADHASLTVEKSPVDLAGELHKIADYFEGIGEERNMRFEVNASGTGSANLDMWRRAVNNLVVNAVRYGYTGTAILLSAHEDHHGATIVVENHGETIPQEQMDRVFDRFYRGDKSRSEFTESSGLGLAIVKAIMVLHGGNAEVSCSPDGLVRFSLYFPAAGSRRREV